MMPIDVMIEAQKHGLKVEFVNNGIASRIKDTIIMNINLPKYPDFCSKVLDHEIRHSGKNTKKDLFMDIVEGSIIDNMIFSFRHPKALSQFIPFGKYKGEWFIDVNMIIVYILMVMILGGYLLMT